MKNIIIIVGSILVITSRNPVHSIINLIMVFIGVSIMWLIEYSKLEVISLIYIIIYVGAIAILFIFIIMMLGKDLEPRYRKALGPSETPHYLIIIISISIIFYIIVIGDEAVSPKACKGLTAFTEISEIIEYSRIIIEIIDIEIIGYILYTYNSIIIIIISFILLLVMVGIIEIIK